MNRPETKYMKFVLITHGSGDSPVSYSKSMTEYDLNLLGSDEIVRLGKEKGLGEKTLLKNIGYAKLDLALKMESKKIFSNGNPTFLFNPSYVKQYSSWNAWGIQC